MPEYKEIEGQCGTCRWAVGFDYAGSPSGPEDGVHCASADHARELDNLSQNDLATEFRTQGYMQFWRLEALAEEDFRCAYWQPKGVLLIPNPEEGKALPYDIVPGYYTMPALVALLRGHKGNPDAIQFIADMLED